MKRPKHRRDNRREPIQITPAQPCPKMHFDTIEKVEVMEVVLRRQGSTPVHEWSAECGAWHVGAVA